MVGVIGRAGANLCEVIGEVSEIDHCVGCGVFPVGKKVSDCMW